MYDGKFEQMLEKLLKADFSAGTEAFREELLARCLSVLDADALDAVGDSDAGFRIVELDDADLELLAAAGDAAHIGKPPSPGSGNNSFGHLPDSGA